MPVASPASTSTSTSVVLSHCSVPSASGPSVGTVYAEARTARTGTWTFTWSSSPPVVSGLLALGQELLRLGLEALLDHLPALGVALEQRLGELLHLLERGVRRDRRDLRVAVDV